MAGENNGGQVKIIMNKKEKKNLNMREVDRNLTKRKRKKKRSKMGGRE